MDQKARDTFSSTYGVFMAAIASAVGLGSIWRFPYLLGANGGGAFLIIYISFMLVIGMPVLLSEFFIGRRGQGNAFRSFKELSPKSYWYLAGLIGILANLVILSFYSTIAGWFFQYTIIAAKDIFTRPVAVDHSLVFEAFTSQTILPLVWMFVFMGLTTIIVMLGVQKGIEKYTKILTPIMFCFLLIIAVKGLTLPGSLDGLKFLFTPDFSKISTSSILSALGQAAFSLSIGSGLMITYGSYIKKNENLQQMAFSVTIVDIIAATICAVAIFPPLFALNMPPEQGTGLIFVVYPAVFEQMRGGYAFSMLFFIMLIITALTSAIPLLETAIAFLKEEFKLKRSTATMLSVCLPAFLSIFTTLSFGPLKNLKIFGRTFFDASDFFASNILLPLGLLCVVVFLGWFYNRDHIKDEITNQGQLSAKLFPIYLFIIRYLAPLAMLYVFLKGFGWEGFGLLESVLGQSS